jgi:hypothetical protein
MNTKRTRKFACAGMAMAVLLWSGMPAAAQGGLRSGRHDSGIAGTGVSASTGGGGSASVSAGGASGTVGVAGQAGASVPLVITSGPDTLTIPPGILRAGQQVGLEPLAAGSLPHRSGHRFISAVRVYLENGGQTSAGAGFVLQLRGSAITAGARGYRQTAQGWTGISASVRQGTARLVLPSFHGSIVVALGLATRGSVANDSAAAASGIGAKTRSGGTAGAAGETPGTKQAVLPILSGSTVSRGHLGPQAAHIPIRKRVAAWGRALPTPHPVRILSYSRSGLSRSPSPRPATRREEWP